MSYFENKLRLVLDTDVVVSAMRSPGGASAELLVAALEGIVTPVINVAADTFEQPNTLVSMY